MSVVLDMFAYVSMYCSLSVTPEQDCKLPKEDIGDPKQRLALHVIKTECKFVPEHVEKRTLYNPLTPGIRQVHNQYI